MKPPRSRYSRNRAACASDAALGDLPAMQANVARIRETRAVLTVGLTRLGFGAGRGRADADRGAI